MNLMYWKMEKIIFRDPQKKKEKGRKVDSGARRNGETNNGETISKIVGLET